MHLKNALKIFKYIFKFNKNNSEQFCIIIYKKKKKVQLDLYYYLPYCVFIQYRMIILYLCIIDIEDIIETLRIM